MKSGLGLYTGVCLLFIGGCGADSDSTTTSSLTTSNGAPHTSGAGGASASQGGSSTAAGQSSSGGSQNVAGTSGAGGASTAGVTSTGGTTGGEVDCVTIDQALADFVATNRDCGVEFNCVVAYADCAPIRSFCDGSVYLNAGYDAVEFMHLLDIWRGCNGDIDCAICDALTPPPACVEGVCVPQTL